MSLTKDSLHDLESSVRTGTRHAREGAKDFVDSAYDAANATIDRVAKAGEQLREEFDPTVSRATAKTQKVAQDAWRATKEVGSAVRKSAVEVKDRCETYVSEQPLKSVAIAAAVGASIAAAALIMRSRRVDQRFH